MKLRIRGNSVRLRLTRSEVAALAEQGEVSERCCFGGDSVFGYCLRADEQAERVQARFADGCLGIAMPRSVALHWAGSDEISVEGEQATGGAERLRVLIEKDFACLAERAGEDDSDAYPHPRDGGSC